MRNKKRLYSLALMLAFGGWHSPWWSQSHSTYTPTEQQMQRFANHYVHQHNKAWFKAQRRYNNEKTVFVCTAGKCRLTGGK